MSGYDRTIDPVTGDYQDATGGEYAETLTIAPQVYHQLKGERRWWGDPNAGSDLYLTKHKGTGLGGQVFATNAIKTALQPFVDAGQAADLEVKAKGLKNGRIVIETSLTDVQYGRLEFAAPVGEV